MIHLVGSPAYDEGQITLGTAEGGLKVTLYNVNTLDPHNPDIEVLNFGTSRPCIMNLLTFCIRPLSFLKNSMKSQQEDIQEQVG